MQQWEYKTLGGNQLRDDRLMTEYGAEGWELVLIVEAKELGLVGWFKRPLNNARLPIEVEVVNDSPINVNSVSSP